MSKVELMHYIYKYIYFADSDQEIEPNPTRLATTIQRSDGTYHRKTGPNESRLFVGHHTTLFPSNGPVSINHHTSPNINQQSQNPAQ